MQALHSSTQAIYLIQILLLAGLGIALGLVVGATLPFVAKSALANLVPDATEAAGLAQHLRPLVGLHAEDEVVADSQIEAFAAWRHLFEAMAEQHPVVLVFEDIHWAEPTLLDLLEYVLGFSSGAPILLLCLARPDLFDVRPSWAAPRPRATLVSLSPLTDNESEDLIGSLAPVE